MAVGPVDSIQTNEPPKDKTAANIEPTNMGKLSPFETQVMAFGESECKKAIREIWPKELQVRAIGVMHGENGTEKPGRLGARNSNGSRDHGCMQINDGVWLGKLGWTHKADIYKADFNIALAYKIYQRSNNFCPWYGGDGYTQKRVFTKRGSKCYPQKEVLK